jgi:poly(hydroxyalkanoate) depolymerase family esterase
MKHDSAMFSPVDPPVDPSVAPPVESPVDPDVAESSVVLEVPVVAVVVVPVPVVEVVLVVEVPPVVVDVLVVSVSVPVPSSVSPAESEVVQADINRARLAAPQAKRIMRISQSSFRSGAFPRLLWGQCFLRDPIPNPGSKKLCVFSRRHPGRIRLELNDDSCFILTAVSSFNWQRSVLVGVAVLALASCDEEGFVPDEGDAQFRMGAGNYAPLSFPDNPGALNAYVYVPATPPAGPAPLVVAMHACSQNASAYRAAGWEELADEMGFYVLYPEQTSANNQAGCFNWAGEYGDTANLTRGQGENQSIKSMIDTVKGMYDIDDFRVYATGHSGGGAEVALLLATWPDVFAGGGIFAGIPFHCTTSYNQVSTCLNPGIDKTPEEHAQFVFDAYPGFTGTYPKLSIWHGTSDFFVQPMNQTELLEQWSTVHGIDMTPDVTETIGAGERSEYQDANGNAIIETWKIQGGSHATFNAPSEGCGTAGSYFEDKGLCGPRYMAEFWALSDPATGDTDGTGGGDDGGDSGASGGDSGASGGDSGASGGDSGADDSTGGGDDGGGDGGGGDGSGGQAGQDEDGDARVQGVGLCSVDSDRPLGGAVWLAMLGLLGFTRRRTARAR